MSYVRADYFLEDPVSQAEQEYREILTRWGLEDLTKAEMDRAKAALIGQNRTRITPGDIQFQAACARLQARRDLTAQTVEAAVRELLEGEYVCDQAEWERSCLRTAAMAHSHYMVAITPSADHKSKAHAPRAAGIGQQGKA